MTLLSLAFASPEHTVAGSNEILKEVMAMVKPTGLERLIVEPDLSCISVVTEKCQQVQFDLGFYVGTAHPDARRREIVEQIVLLTELVKTTTEKLIALDPKPWTLGGIQMRHDAYTWYSVLSEVAEDGMTTELYELVQLKTTKAIEMSVDPHTEVLVEAPPGYENDPTFLTAMKETNAGIEAAVEVAHRFADYVLSQCQTMNQVQTLHLLVNHD